MCGDNGNRETHLDRSNDDERAGTNRQIRTTWTPPEKPHAAIVTAIARARGEDPIALDPLYDSIAVDALDALLAGTRGPNRSAVRVSFFHDGLAIAIDGNGTLTVAGRANDRE